VKFFTNQHLPALVIIPLLTCFLVLGAASVPFHPDEASLLYQSRDLETWLTHPLALSWQPSGAPDDPSNYRALNAPLPKYVLGIGRRLAGFGPQSVSVDWDWTRSWAANVRAGALPDARLLLGARLASTLLVGVALVFIYMAGLTVSGRLTGLLAVGLVAGNALVLLHARRAMAEGTLLMAASMAIWGITVAGRRPWLAGTGAALAFAAKQSAAPLALLGLIASLWPSPRGARIQWKSGLRFSAAALGLTAILQPFFWTHPLGAAQAMMAARQSLLASQVESVRSVAPNRVLDGPEARGSAILGELFVIPPQLSEVGNYAAETAAQDQAYLDNPLHRMFRGFWGGGLLLALTLLGLITSLWPAEDLGRRRARARVWLAIAGGAEIVALLVANPLPVQRYYVPIIPFIALWAAFGAAGLVHLLVKRTQVNPVPSS
jgi:4-amino-4-deoxy-L-arabinose transferase-like glycosyltransferase